MADPSPAGRPASTSACAATRVARASALAVGVGVPGGGIAAQPESPALTTAAAQVDAARGGRQGSRYVPVEAMRERGGRVPAVLERRVTVRRTRTPLQHVLVEIATQAGLGLSYGEDLVRAAPEATLDVHSIPAVDALAAAARGTGFAVLVTASGQVAVVRAPAPARAVVAVVAGTVADSATGQPLPGVQITLESAAAPGAGPRRGAVTGPGGRFRIAGVPAGSYTLVARRIGYAPGRRAVTLADGQTLTADLALAAQATALAEVVQIGYGTQRRRDVTGAVASVSARDFDREPVPSVGQALQGRVAGVQVTQSTGQPGGALSVRIRGGTSISAGNEPLYVIDGIPVYNNDQATSTRSTNPVNALAALNPEDVESVEVLKDASSTAIYGSRGANGVVIISTKRGRAGRSDVDLEVFAGTQSVARRVPLLGAAEYARYVNEAFANANRAPAFTEGQMATVGAGTDWQREIFRGAPVQNVQLGFRGGDERTRYALSGGYFGQDGVVLGSNFRRGSFRLNLDREVGGRLSVGNSLTLSRTTSSVRPTSDASGVQGVVASALFFAPTLPVRDSAGGYTANNATWGEIAGNPVATALGLTDRRSANRVLGNVFADYRPAEHLRLRVSVGLDNLDARDEYFAPSSIFAGQGVRGDASLGTVSTFTWLNENTLTYARRAGQHDVNLLGGVTVQHDRSERAVSSAQRFPNDITGVNDLSAAEVVLPPVSGATTWGLLSYLARANYGFGDRYLLTATARVDGSSRFGADNRYGFFPSASVAWRANREAFLRDRRWLSELKFRLSYGVTGNQEIGLYQALSALGTSPYVLGNNTAVGYAPVRVGNPDLRWESTRQLDGGFDLGLFDGALLFTADVYDKTTRDLLLNVPIPATSGYTVALRNAGSVRNRGVELSLEGTRRLGRVTWRPNLNASANRSRVLSLGGLPSFTTGAFSGSVSLPGVSRVEQERPLGEFYGFRTDGLFQTAAEVAASAQKNAKPGEIRYRDLNGDGVINNSDRTYIGNGFPRLLAGFGSTLTLGRFDLNFLVQGSFGNDVLNGTAFLATYTPNGVAVPTTEARGRWTGPGTSNRVPRADANAARPLFADNVIEDGSYIRGKNIALNYRLPTDRVRVLRGARNARVFVAAQNFFTVTDYTGFDPEVSTRGQTLTPGVDFVAYPSARTYTFGMSMGL
jgi:TonB-linked SusC/RagA family outer membrane protein